MTTASGASATGSIPPDVAAAAYRDLGSGKPEPAIQKTEGSPLPTLPELPGVIHHTLSCDPNFNRYSLVWMLGPTLDATHMAAETLRMTTWGRTFVEERKDRLKEFLSRHYLPETGRFRTHASRQSSPGGIFAAHAGLGVAKAILGGDPRDPLMKNKGYRELLLGLGLGRKTSVDPVEGLHRLVEETAAASPAIGTLVDHPEARRLPTVTSLHTGFGVLWNLYDLKPAREILFDILDREAVLFFLRECLQWDKVSGSRVAGFTVHPKIEELCVNTTYFALRLIGRLELEDEILDEETRQAILRFLRLSFKGYGFQSTLEETYSLNATYFGLEALKHLQGREAFKGFCRVYGPILESFVTRCTWEETGGAAFTTDKTRYADNCVATRYAARIIKAVREASGITGDEAVPKDLLRFCADRFDEASGGFRAYPEGRIPMPPDAERWVGEKISEKDEKLSGALPDWTVERNPLEEIHRQLDRAHEELDRLVLCQERGDADPALQRSIVKLSAEIEELKEREADTWERQFEASLPYPLDHGEKELAEAREYLAQLRGEAHAGAST